MMYGIRQVQKSTSLRSILPCAAGAITVVTFVNKVCSFLMLGVTYRASPIRRNRTHDLVHERSCSALLHGTARASLLARSGIPATPIRNQQFTEQRLPMWFIARRGPLGAWAAGDNEKREAGLFQLPYHIGTYVGVPKRI